MDTRQHDWRARFVAALTKVDEADSLAGITIADDAVFLRLLELEGTTGTEAERRALEDTMQDIRMLRDRNSHFRG